MSYDCETASITATLPHKCTSSTSSRYALANVFCLPNQYNTGVFLASTDGRCLAVNSAEGVASGACMIAGELLEKITKPTKIEKQGEGMEWTARVGNKITVAEAKEGRFPRVEEVFGDIGPKLVEKASPDNGNTDVYQATHEFVTINVELLLKVAQTITTAEDDGSAKLPVTIAIPHDKSRPVTVIGTRGIGLVMPLAIGNTQGEIEQEHAERAKRYESIRQEYIEAAQRAKEIELREIERQREEAEAKKSDQEEVAA